MYRASDAVEHETCLADLEAAADDLCLSADAVVAARDLFLSAVPEAERSRPPAVAASLYAGALVAGERRTQTAVAEAVGVSRLAVQDRWKDRLAAAGLEAPDW